MPGPMPKHVSAKSTPRKASTRAVLYEIPPEEIQVPDLPRRFDNDGEPIIWRLETQDWWRDIWSSPMSGEYHPSDVHGLFRLAVLIDQFWGATGGDLQKISAEIRLVQRDYGMTPLDRRRLEWTIETAEKAKADGAKRVAAQTQTPPADGDADPRLSIA